VIERKVDKSVWNEVDDEELVHKESENSQNYPSLDSRFPGTEPYALVLPLTYLEC